MYPSSPRILLHLKCYLGRPYREKPLPLWLPHGPDLGTERPQNQWRRQTKHQGDKSKRTVPPSPPKAVIHCRRKDGEHEACGHAQNLRGRRGRSSVFAKRVEDVSSHCLCAEYEAAAEDGRSNVRHDPVEFRLRRPAVPEEADGDEETAWDHERNAVLGRGGTAGPLLQTSPEAVGDLCSDLIREAIADG